MIDVIIPLSVWFVYDLLLIANIANWLLFLQIVSGRPKQGTFVLHHLIGAAVEFAGLLRGLKRYIGGVERVRMLCGVPLSRGQKSDSGVLPNSGRLILKATSQACKIFYFFFFFYSFVQCREKNVILHEKSRSEREI